MPYILVEMTNPIGGKELLAVPASWIESRSQDEQAYLCWPYARSIRKLNELFADEHSTPLDVWPKHECEVLCRNIPSLSLADKMIETMEISQQETVAARVVATKRNESLRPLPSLVLTSRAVSDVGGVQRMLSSITNLRPDQQETVAARVVTAKRNESLRPLPSLVLTSRTVGEVGGTQKLLSSIVNLRPDDDPLSDVKPCPPMLDLMYELKRLIQANQEEMRQKLKEGFGKVEKTVEKMNEKYLESNAKQYEKGRADARVFQQEGQPQRFQVKCMTEMAEVDEFEERLQDEEYRTQVCQWIDESVGNLRESEHRMHTLLDLIYDRKLFAGFSWTGAGKDKRALHKLNNTFSLFEYAGTTSVVRVDRRAVENFMRKKLANAVTRIRVKGVRRSVPRSFRTVRKRQRVEVEGTVTIIPKSLIVTSTTDTPHSATVRPVCETQNQAKPSTSGVSPHVVRVPADPLSSDDVVFKQVPIEDDGLNDLEELFNFKRLSK